MLNALRHGAKGTLAKVLLFSPLLLAMAGVALMDGSGMVRGGTRPGVVAEIGKQAITTAEIDAMVQTAIRNQGMTQEQAIAADLPRRLLQREIDSRLIRMEAEDLGLHLDDVSAAAEIKKIIDPMVKEEKISPQQALARLMQATNTTEGQLVDSIKTQGAIVQLTGALSSGIRPPKQMIEDALKYRFEARKGEYFRLNTADLGKIETPADDKLKEYYATIANRFAMPERRSFKVLTLDATALGIPAKATAEDAKAYYDSHTDEFSTPERRKIAQLVVKDEAMAKELETKAAANKDLKKLKSADASYSEGTFSEADMPVELADVAFKTAKEGIAVAKSALGFHVLHIADVTPAKTDAFDKVKDGIVKKISSEKSAEALYEKANEIDDAIAGGQSIDEVAASFKITPLTFENITSDGTGKNGAKAGSGVPMFDKLLENAFKLQEGDASQLIETEDGSFMIVGVTDIIPSANDAFENVKDKVTDSWKTMETRRLLDEKAGKILSDLRVGASMTKVAGDLGKKVEIVPFTQRLKQSKSEKDMRPVIMALFAIEQTGGFTSTALDQGVAIVRFTDRKGGDATEATRDERDNLTALLRTALQNDLFDQYRMALMDKYNVYTHEEVLEGMYNTSNGGL